MNREQALLKNTLIITVGKICTQLISFFLLPLYTAILSTSEYGVVDLMNTIVSLLLPVVTLQTEQAVFRELVNERGNLGRSKRIVSTGIYTFVAQCTAFILLFLFLSPLVHNEYKLFIFLNVLSNACVFCKSPAASVTIGGMPWAALFRRSARSDLIFCFWLSLNLARRACCWQLSAGSLRPSYTCCFPCVSIDICRRKYLTTP